MSTETVALISAGSICAILLVVAGCIFYRQSIRRARHRRSEEVVHNLYSANGYNKPAHYGGTPGSRPTSAAKKEAFLVGLLAPLSPTSKKAFLADDMYTVRYPTKTSSRSDDQRKSTLTKYHDLPSFAEANQNAYPAMDGGSEVGSQVGAVPPFAYDPYTGQPTYGFDPNYQPGYTYSQGYVPDPQYAGASFTDSQLANYPGYYDQNGQYHWFQNEGIPMAQAQPYPAFPFDPNQVAMYPVENVTEPTPPPSALDTQTVAPPTPPPKS
ncbi:hypothetical protein BC829DRAFT_378934 [Chytridium lagenaria]|nr:hypothetical protein BC829DRAFT_378934 [Chytridium lagenaria]